MTALDFTPANASGLSLSRKMIPLLAALALLGLFGLPALMAPAPPGGTGSLQWHGNSAILLQDR